MTSAPKPVTPTPLTTAVLEGDGRTYSDLHTAIAQWEAGHTFLLLPKVRVNIGDSDTMLNMGYIWLKFITQDGRTLGTHALKPLEKTPR